MATPIARRALSLLPPCATTGIGSLPHTQLELALQTALQMDIPYLPQLPSGNPSELMIPSALDGLPGLHFDAEGLCTVDRSEWAAGGAGMAEALDAALSNDETSRFEPTAQASRAWRPFLWEVEHRRLPFAKVQIAGPCTVRWVAKTSAGEPVSAWPELEQQMYRLLLAKGLAMVKALRSKGATPIVYLDEPGLYALDRRDPRHLVMLQELKLMVVALQREGALVGLHCCSNTQWDTVLELGLDILSLDVRLSLDAVLDERVAFLGFLMSGATLSLGIVPTDLASSYNVNELVEAVEVSLRSTLPRPGAFAQVCSQLLLTPACGLAMRSVMDAERIFDEVRLAQRALRQLADAGERTEPVLPSH